MTYADFAAEVRDAVPCRLRMRNDLQHIYHLDFGTMQGLPLPHPLLLWL